MNEINETDQLATVNGIDQLLTVNGANQLAVPDQVTTPLPLSASLVPDKPILTKQTYASLMSFVGITRRTIAWFKRASCRSLPLAILAYIGGSLFLALMYSLITVWYLVIFVLFGFFTIPYRLVRRSQRKSQHLQATQLATMQAMLVNQQQVLAENKNRQG